MCRRFHLISDLGDASGSEPIVELGSVLNIGESDGIERVIGFTAAELRSCIWLSDNRSEWPQLVATDGVFNGAFVALVLHDPLLAERSVDATERAASLISSGSGTVLCVAPFAARTLDNSPLTARQWNYAIAMIERLCDVSNRFRLALYVRANRGQICPPSGTLRASLVTGSVGATMIGGNV